MDKQTQLAFDTIAERLETIENAGENLTIESVGYSSALSCILAIVASDLAATQDDPMGYLDDKRDKSLQAVENMNFQGDSPESSRLKKRSAKKFVNSFFDSFGFN